MSIRLMLTLAAALVAGAPAIADDCCGGAEKKAAQGGGCCEGEKAAKGGDQAACLAKCDEKRAAALEGVLAKLGGGLPKLAAEDAKAVADAQKTLATTCPAGKTLMGSLPAMLEGIEAVRALDLCMEQGGKTLPADCQTKEGGCAFCAEAGGKCSEAAKAAIGVSGKAMARAEKIAKALAAIAATYPRAGATTKPAGSPATIPTKEHYGKLAERAEASAKAIADGFAAAKALPEADKKKIEAAMATLDKLAPAVSPTTCMAGYGALFQELCLAGEAAAVFAKEGPAAKDPKLVESLSPNAKNAFALFGARTALVAALGHVGAAACAAHCEGEKGAHCEGEKEKQ